MDEILKNRILKNRILKNEILQKIANTIRQLSIEAIEKANSGHPGLPLGCAEIGAYLYSVALKHDPKNPKWINRDRFILSAGHGSMLLYSCLHLSGFDLSLEDIKKFRSLHSKTPGHPEYLCANGVETTTGPLGQGIGNAVGMAIGQKILKEKFSKELFDSKIYCLAGDGCIMEGISSEASSLAGHLKLDNLIVIYDANNICLDGPLSECCTEDTKKRYASYGWEVYDMDPYDFSSIHSVISEVKKEQKAPVLIFAKTIIGKGSPNMEGSHNVHGKPLGFEELAITKKNLNLPEEKFFIPSDVREFFKKRLEEQRKYKKSWDEEFKKWSYENKELYEEFLKMKEKKLPEDLKEKLFSLNIKSPISTRKASGEIINYLADFMPYLYSGSSDLSSSDMTMIKNYNIISSSDFKGRNIKYGVREFAMGCISTGLSQMGMFLPISGTFLVFSDYMKAAIRLASLSKVKVIYQLTHDSIFLAEDGPTHQPVEQLASLRAIPNLHVIRPSCVYELKAAWLAALNYKGPSALILSRQNLMEIENTHIPYEEGMAKGGYIVLKEDKKPDYTIFATGSELYLALEIALELKKRDKDVRVVSMPCFELFEKTDQKYKDQIIGGDIGKRISIEAASDMGWHKYIGKDGIAICVDSFGASASKEAICQEFGFTIDSILQRIL